MSKMTFADPLIIINFSYLLKVSFVSEIWLRIRETSLAVRERGRWTDENEDIKVMCDI